MRYYTHAGILNTFFLLNCKVTHNFFKIANPRFNKMLENLSDESEKWTYLFNNLSKMNEIPEEFDELVSMASRTVYRGFGRTNR